MQEYASIYIANLQAITSHEAEEGQLVRNRKRLQTSSLYRLRRRVKAVFRLRYLYNYIQLNALAQYITIHTALAAFQ